MNDTNHATPHAGHLLRPPRYTRFPSDGREKNRVKGRSDSEPDEPRPSPPPHVLPFVHLMYGEVKGVRNRGHEDEVSGVSGECETKGVSK